MLDLYSEKDRIVGEMCEHIGSLKIGQQHKISQEILKRILMEKLKGANTEGYLERLCCFIL